MNRKKITALALTAAISAAVLAGCGSSAASSAAPAADSAADSATTDTAASADLLSQIRERGTITVAMEGTWAPWTYHDENDNLVGYDVEVATLIAEKLGVEPEFIEGESGTACWPVWTLAVTTSWSTAWTSPRARREIRLLRAVRLQPHRRHHQG